MSTLHFRFTETMQRLMCTILPRPCCASHTALSMLCQACCAGHAVLSITWQEVLHLLRKDCFTRARRPSQSHLHKCRRLTDMQQHFSCFSAASMLACLQCWQHVAHHSHALVVTCEVLHCSYEDIEALQCSRARTQEVACVI